MEESYLFKASNKQLPCPCCHVAMPRFLTQFVPGVAMVDSGYLDLQFAPNLTCSLRNVMPRYDQSSTGLRLRPGNLQNGPLGDTTPFDCIGGVPNCSNMGPFLWRFTQGLALWFVALSAARACAIASKLKL